MSRLRPATIGAAAGTLVFLAMTAWTAQSVFGVADVARDPGKFYGRSVRIEGIIKSPRLTTRYVGKKKIEVVNFYLHEPGGRRGTGDRYVTVYLPSDQFRSMPREGEGFIVQGALKAPNNVGTIEP